MSMSENISLNQLLLGCEIKMAGRVLLAWEGRRSGTLATKLPVSVLPLKFGPVMLDVCWSVRASGYCSNK